MLNRRHAKLVARVTFTLVVGAVVSLSLAVALSRWAVPAIPMRGHMAPDEAPSCCEDYLEESDLTCLGGSGFGFSMLHCFKRSGPPGEGSSGNVTCIRAGWPFLALEGKRVIRHTPIEITGFEYAGLVRQDVTVKNLIPPPGRDGLCLGCIPTSPRWLGLTLNTLVFATIASVLVHGRSWLRRAYRHHRQLCAVCGYPKHGVQRCPECGEGGR